MVRLGNIFLTLLFLGALAAVIATGWLAHEVTSPGPLVAEKLVYIEPGRSIKSISAKLLESGVIRDDVPFMLDARWRNREKELKAGEYLFPAHINISDVISLLQGGKTYQHKITIPEGLTAIEI
ncbi:MAG: endolytic transglycosylase MltG, partial [Proteobacteria bacterium]|nr:endolytic transglycosylase MltG [Pseudomonadota bacterium]